MIAVSQEFKSAIKNRERQIKGYVELINNAIEVEMTATTNYSQTYANVSNIVDGEPVKLNYGTLDNLPLDGSQLVMGNFQNEKSPFIVAPFLGEDKQIEISLERTKVDTITIIPQKIKLFWGEPEYKLFNAHVTLKDGNNEVYNEYIDYTNEDINVKLDTPTYITKIFITLLPSYWAEHWNDIYMMKLNQVVIGDTKIIQDNDLVNFTIDEEISKLVEETPTNETKITIPRPESDSYLSNTFLQNMNEKAKIIPYIGVVTENGPEYVKMGEFYFNEVAQNRDKTTSIYGQTLMKNLELETITCKSTDDIFIDVSISPEELKTYLQENYNYEINQIDFPTGANVTILSYVIYNERYLLNLLRESAFVKNCLLYFDRNAKLNLTTINNNAVDTLLKTELLENAFVTALKRPNKIIKKYKYPDVTNGTPQTPVEEIFSQTVTLQTSPQEFLFIANKSISGNVQYSQTGGTNYTVLGSNYFMVSVQLEGTVGTDVTFKIFSNDTTNDILEKAVTLVNDDGNKEEILEYQSQVSFANFMDKFGLFPNYKMDFSYNGDPSLEAGDYINVQLEDGTFARLFIEKNHFEFDGGLKGRIEGVE